MRMLFVIILILLVVGASPRWPYSAEWGYWPMGGAGFVLLVVLILLLVGAI